MLKANGFEVPSISTHLHRLPTVFDACLTKNGNKKSFLDKNQTNFSIPNAKFMIKLKQEENILTIQERRNET